MVINLVTIIIITNKKRERADAKTNMSVLQVTLIRQYVVTS